MSAPRQTQQLIEKLSTWLGNRNYDEIFAFVEEQVERETIQKRIMLHYQALAHMHMGALNKAKLELQKILKFHGENIGIYRDLACCYYQLGELEAWRATYRQLNQWINDNFKLVTPTHLFSCYLILGKFYEEEGQIHQALTLYQRVFDNSGLISSRRDFYFQAGAQLLRAHAIFRNGENLGNLYSEFLSYDKKQVTLDTQLEIQHGLMLAEMNLVGPHHAWTRVRATLEDEAIPENDKRLMFYDYLEEKLHRKLEITNQEKQIAESLTLRDPYEHEIYILATKPEEFRSLDELVSLSSDLCWASYLRILILYYLHSKDAASAEELQRKIHLLLGAFSPESRQLWLNRFRPVVSASDPVLHFSAKRRAVRFQNKEIDLSRRKGMLQLVALLSERPALDVDQAIRDLWESSFSPEHYHRLRMTVHRLNRILYDLTAIPKVIEVNSDRVNLSPNVKLHLETQIN